MKIFIEVEDGVVKNVIATGDAEVYTIIDKDDLEQKKVTVEDIFFYGPAEVVKEVDFTDRVNEVLEA